MTSCELSANSVVQDARAWAAWLAPLEAAAMLPQNCGLSSAYTAFRARRGDASDVGELRRSVATAQRSDGAGGGTLLALRDTSGGICGLFCTFPWEAAGATPFGNLTKCFVFGLEMGGTAQVWGGDADDDCFDADDNTEVGALRFSVQGLTIGGSRTGTALMIAADLHSATTGRSSHFGNDPLLRAQELQVLDLVVLRLGTEPSTSVSNCSDPEDNLHCKQDGPNSFLLNFISSSSQGAIGRHHFS